MDKPETVCGTVAIGTAKKEGDGTTLLDRIVNSCYEKCRSNNTIIPTFTDFQPLLAEMNQNNSSAETADPGYQVTCLHPSGALIIKESFFEQFGKGDSEMKEFDALVADHNSRYNDGGLRLGSDAAASTATIQDAARPERVAVLETAEPLTADSLAKLDVWQPRIACRRTFNHLIHFQSCDPSSIT